MTEIRRWPNINEPSRFAPAAVPTQGDRASRQFFVVASPSPSGRCDREQ
jgi:hypothetical protein